MALEVLGKHEEIRHRGIRKTVWIEIWTVRGRFRGLEIEHRLIIGRCRVHSHLRLDAADGAHHHFVDADALDAGRRVFDFPVVSAGNNRPPRVEDAVGQFGLGVVGIAVVDEVGGQLQAPQARVRREPVAVGNVPPEDADGLEEEARVHHKGLNRHVFAEQTEAEAFGINGQPERPQRVPDVVAPILGEHVLDLFGEGVVVVEAQAADERLVPKLTVRREEAEPVAPAEVVANGQRPPETGRYRTDGRHERQLAVGAVVPVAELAEFVDQSIPVVVYAIVFSHDVAGCPVGRVFLGFVDPLEIGEMETIHPVVKRAACIVVRNNAVVGPAAAVPVDARERRPEGVAVVVHPAVSGEPQVVLEWAARQRRIRNRKALAPGRAGTHLRRVLGSGRAAGRQDARVPLARVETEAQVAFDRWPCRTARARSHAVFVVACVVGRVAVDDVEIEFRGGVFDQHGHTPHHIAHRFTRSREMGFNGKPERLQIGVVIDLVEGLDDVGKIGLTLYEAPCPDRLPRPRRLGVGIGEDVLLAVVHDQVVVIVEHIDVAVGINQRIGDVDRHRLIGRQAVDQAVINQSLRKALGV